MIRSLSIFCIFLFCGQFYSSAVEYDYIRQDRNGKYITISKLNNKYGVVDIFGNEIIEPIYSYISYSQDSLFFARNDSAYGIFDLQGKIVLPVEYDQPISFLKGDYYLFSQNDRFGVFDRKNRTILIQPKFKKIDGKDYKLDDIGFSKSDSVKTRTLRRSFLAYNLTDSITSQSLIDLNTGSEIISERVYDDIKPSDECGYIVVSKNNQQQVIDYDQNIIIPYQDKEISPTRFGFLLYKNFSYQFVSKNTSKASPIYDSVVMFSNGFAIVSKANKKGVINRCGEEIIPTSYDEIYLSTNNVLADNIIAISNVYENDEEDSRYDFFDLAGNKIVSTLDYRNVDYCDKKGVFIVEDSEGRQGLVNTEGRILLPLKYRRIYIDEYLDIVRLEMDTYKMGIANLAGDILVEPRYDDLSDFVRGVAEVGIQNGNEYYYGLIDSKGDEILSPQFTSLFFNLDDNKEYATAYLDNRIGIVSRTGVVTVKPQYDDIIYQKRSGDDWGYLAVSKLNGKYGLLNITTGEVLRKTIYQHIFAIGKGDSILFCLRTNEGNSLIDKQGNVVIPPTSDIIYSLVEGRSDFWFKHDSKLGVITRDNQNIIPLEYDKVSLLKNNLFKVDKGGKVGILNQQGETVFPLEFDFIEPYLSPDSGLLFAKRGNDYGYIFIDKTVYEVSKIGKEVYESMLLNK